MKRLYTIATALLLALLAAQAARAQTDNWQRLVDEKRFAEVLALAEARPDSLDYAAL